MKNQLIIIGNGFDVECGLESKYTDYFAHRFDAKHMYGDFSFDAEDRNLWDYFFLLMRHIPDSECPVDWKDVETVIQQWTTALVAAQNGDYDSFPMGNPLIISQYVIGRFLSKSPSMTYFTDQILKNPTSARASYEKVSSMIDKIGGPPYIRDGRYLKTVLEIFPVFLDFLININAYMKGLRIYATIDELLFDELKKCEKSFAKYMHSIINGNYQIKAEKLYHLISQEFSYNAVLNSTYVLSFNYTQPKIIYKSNGPQCWRNVHGNLSSKNIILGFDIEDLSDEHRKDQKLRRFTKTYRLLQLIQRVDDKQSGLLEPLSNNEKFDMIKIYGHSLNRSDYSYFKAIFDCVNLYSSDVKLRFLYPSDLPKDKIPELYESVANLLTDYGYGMPDKDKGRNLMHKLLLEDRLSVTEIDTQSLR